MSESNHRIKESASMGAFLVYAVINENKANGTACVARYRAGMYCLMPDRTYSGYGTIAHGVNLRVLGKPGAAG